MKNIPSHTEKKQNSQTMWNTIFHRWSLQASQIHRQIFRTLQRYHRRRAIPMLCASKLIHFGIWD